MGRTGVKRPLFFLPLLTSLFLPLFFPRGEEVASKEYPLSPFCAVLNRLTWFALLSKG